MASSRARWWLLWALWVAVILLAGIVPLDNFVGHSHWPGVRWLSDPPPWSSPRALAELAANVLLYLPFGFLLAAASRRPTPTLRWLAAAAALSAAIEVYQVYCHNRHPTVLDLASNVTGAYAGLRLGRFLRSAP
jgi:VanZ family protein